MGCRRDHVFGSVWKDAFEHSVSGLYRVLLGQYEPFDDSFSSRAKDVIGQLLVVDPDRRLNAPQCAQHDFFNTSGETAAAGLVATVASRAARRSQFTLHALTVHEEVEKQTAELLAQNLDDDALITVRNWMNMSAEAAEDSVLQSLRKLQKRHCAGKYSFDGGKRGKRSR